MEKEIKKIWISGEEFELGKGLNELGTDNVYNHIQAVVYYKNGIPEIENQFKPSDYIDKGYVCTFVSTINGFLIAFIKFTNTEIVDLIYVNIERSKILRYEEVSASQLKVVKKDEKKHYRKNFGRKAFAVASVIAGAIADQFLIVDTHYVDGFEYKLFYKDKFENIKYLIFYSPYELKNKTTLFLNTYYKSELPEEAKNIIEKKESKCFIATACYRDIFSKEVVFFRSYRDNVLRENIIGRLFIKFYYRTSPFIYNYLFNNPFLSDKIKVVLDYIYRRLNK